MHRAENQKVDESLRNQHQINWVEKCSVLPLKDWLSTQPVSSWKPFFQENGYLVIENLISPDEIQVYRDVYDKLMSGQIDASDHRHDLGNHIERKSNEENICQIMWPSVYVDGLLQGPLHERTKAISQEILGSDLDMDFDMMIYKAPHTNTETPWHQDESYWPDLPDKRAVSCWVALDDATVDNGCMWFVPGSHEKGLKKHRPAKDGCHVLICETYEGNGKPCPIKAGSCTLHHGRTLHHTEGNSTDRQRRAYITNFRPAEMVQKERSLGYDHGKNEGVREIKLKGQAHTT